MMVKLTILLMINLLEIKKIYKFLNSSRKVHLNNQTNSIYNYNKLITLILNLFNQYKQYNLLINQIKLIIYLTFFKICHKLKLRIKINNNNSKLNLQD